MNNQNDPKPNIDQEELDYLYALYKSSQAGSGVKLSKQELKKLLESQKLNIKKEIKEEEVDKKILKLANFMTRTMLKKIDYQYEDQFGKDKWEKTDKLVKNQMIYMDFVKRYKFGPREMKTLIINILRITNNNA